MTQKKIIYYLQRNPQTSLDKLVAHFDANHGEQKKRLRQVLYQMQDNHLLTFDKSSQRVVYLKKSEAVDKAASFKRTDRRNSKFDSRQQKDRAPAINYTTPDQDVPLICEKYNLPLKFSREVLTDIKNKVWEKSNFLEKNRRDCRDLFVITIDGADSKDLDDAISISKPLFGDWELGVHIADVSYYVPKDSNLDTEALERANSYYLIDTVLPMLPKELSNDLCSLNPQTDKKSLSIFIKFDKEGNVKSYKLEPTLINTNYRMTYDRVEEIIQTGKEKDGKLLKNIKMMEKLFRILNKKRILDGSIEFNFKEKKILLDKEGNPTKLYQKDRQDSERLIEEFMLAANQSVGDYLHKKGLGLYRVHETPPAEKYQRLQNFAAKRGYKLPENPKPKDLQNFLVSLESTPFQQNAEILTLRSMAQAVYQKDNMGHFGLGFDLYAHFTSPIRRYADLVVHRLIKYYLYSENFEQNPYSPAQLDSIGQHISAQERIAMEAERDLQKIKSVRYMKPHEGEVFDGIISSVANFGIFVEIDGIPVEAMIRYADMDEYFIFVEDELKAFNRSKTKTYSIGKKVQIRITKVNTERGFIDAKFLKFLS